MLFLSHNNVATSLMPILFLLFVPKILVRLVVVWYGTTDYYVHAATKISSDNDATQVILHDHVNGE